MLEARRRVCGITTLDGELALVLQPDGNGPAYVPLEEVADASAGRDKYRLARLYVGRTVRVVPLDRGQGALWSIKRAVEAVEPELKKQVISDVAREWDATVVRVSKAGAEVEIEDAVRCWLPVVEYQHEWTPDLRAICPLRSVVRVKVINPCDEQGRIVVSRKVLLPDPWEKAADKYAVGTVWLGILRSIIESGVLVELEPGITARCSMPRKWTPQVNSEVTVEIESVNSETRRMRGRVIWADFAVD